MSNPLVAQRQDSTTALSGVPILESVEETKQGIESGNWASGVLGAAGAGLDALGMAMDPFGAILAAGVGWLMEHVGPVSDALDSLTGDPDEIKAHSQTWKNVSAELADIGAEMTRLVKADTEGWTGAAGDAYRERSGEIATLIEAAQKAAAGAADGVGTAGEVVGAVRMFVRDIIAELVGHLVSWALQVVATLGIGLTWVVPQVIEEVAKVASRIAEITTKLVRAMQQLVPMLQKLAKGFGEATGRLNKIKADGALSSGSRTSSGPKTPSPEAPSPGPSGPASSSSAGTGPAKFPETSGNGAGTGPASSGSAAADAAAPRPGAEAFGGAPRSAAGAEPLGAPVRPPAARRPDNGHRTVGPRPHPIPARGGPPSGPRVISAQSFKTDAERAQFVRDHLPGFQNINKERFDSNTQGYTENCGRCTINTARFFKTGRADFAAPSGTMTLDDVASHSRPAGSTGRFDEVSGYDEINRRMGSPHAPPGHVGTVGARWAGEPVGHFFNVVKANDGSVAYVDGQTGGLADISKQPSKLYFMDYPNEPWQYRDPAAAVPDSPASSRPSSPGPPDSPASPGSSGADVPRPDSPQSDVDMADPPRSPGSVPDVEMADRPSSPSSTSDTPMHDPGWDSGIE